MYGDSIGYCCGVSWENSSLTNLAWVGVGIVYLVRSRVAPVSIGVHTLASNAESATPPLSVCSYENLPYSRALNNVDETSYESGDV